MKPLLIATLAGKYLKGSTGDETEETEVIYELDGDDAISGHRALDLIRAGAGAAGEPADAWRGL